MSPTEPTLTRQFVIVEWSDRTLGIPLEQLEPVDVDADTNRAVTDWRYWLGPN